MEKDFTKYFYYARKSVAHSLANISSNVAGFRNVIEKKPNFQRLYFKMFISPAVVNVRSPYPDEQVKIMLITEIVRF